MLDQIRRLHSARPFTPFALARAAGDVSVTAPEHLAIAPGGDAIYLASGDGLTTIPVSEIAAITLRPSRSAGCELSEVRLLVWDFDGVWSTNQVLVMQDGTEGVLCNRSDGLGLGMLRDAGMPMVVISKEENPVVAARCKKVRIPCRQGIDDKLAVLRSIASDRGITLREIAYVGNDLNDVPCMQAVGVAIAVADAYPEALAAACLVTTRNGGHGAVREVCEWFLAGMSRP